MAEGYSKLTIIGNLGSDPTEPRTTTSGARVTNFSVAVNDRRRQADGSTVENTIWFRVSCFNKLADVASQYLKKGRSVYVEGRVELREYTANDGQKRYSLDVIAQVMQMLDSRSGMPSGEGRQEDSPVYSRQQSPASQAYDDALPF